jgi:hypothetical protein
MYPEELESFTHQFLPQSFFRGALKSLFAAKRFAWDFCKAEFDKPEADNARGTITRAKLEGMLAGAAALVDGATADPVRASRGPWNHREIRSGPVVLTASSVPTPCGHLDDPAEYKLGLAEANEQPFSIFRKPLPRNGRLYVLLLHSNYKAETPEEVEKFGHLPGSAYAAYPVGDLTYYVHETNLFDKFPEVVVDNTPKDWTEDAVARYFRRARKVASA